MGLGASSDDEETAPRLNATNVKAPKRNNQDEFPVDPLVLELRERGRRARMKIAFQDARLQRQQERAIYIKNTDIAKTLRENRIYSGNKDYRTYYNQEVARLKTEYDEKHPVENLAQIIFLEREAKYTK